MNVNKPSYLTFLSNFMKLRSGGQNLVRKKQHKIPRKAVHCKSSCAVQTNTDG
jgi:hypothetical protein